MSHHEISIYHTLKHLVPYDVRPYQKMRFGNMHGDGGYVLLNRLLPEQIIYSFGIGSSVEFDLDMARRGHTVYMFDHTIERLPTEHINFKYYREGISGSDKPSENLYSLRSYLDRSCHTQSNMILKMDVEGAEWDALHHADLNILAQFEQMTFEFHGFQNIDSAEWRSQIAGILEKINRKFTLFHVHGNNYADLVIRGGFTVCPVIEVSYVRTDLINRFPSRSIYPSHLDPVNNPLKFDHPLLFFPFCPVVVENDGYITQERIADMTARLELQLKCRDIYELLHKARLEINRIRTSAS